MRAIVNIKYGSPQVAKLMEIDKPSPKEKEVLIKIHATTVNRTDAGFRSAEYFISRFWTGLFKPKYKTLGCEFAGEIEEIGDKVTLFKKGDKVFGFDSNRCGSHAQYKIIEEGEALELMPQNLTYYEAAPICEGGHYALCDIRAAKVKAGQNVLVNGATGAIGSAAVQLLKHFGAKVTAVCDTKNMMLVKSLGADFVIDYTKEDFTKIDQKFDFIFDAVGKSSFGKCKQLLKEHGIYISTELGKNAKNVYLALSTPILGGKKVLFPIPTIKKEDVVFLKNLVEAGEYKPLLDRQYPLEQIVEAYKYVETGQKIGNVVIRVI
jgi:NADPH:quinone reductase-like Zn-dependent oxidoreductase